MPREVLAGAWRAEMPQHLPRRHHKGGDQDTHPMADVLVLPFLRLARLSQLRRMLALENLHARLLVHTDDQASLLIEAQGMLIEGADVAGLGVERRIMAIQPVDTPMRFQVGLVEHPPEGGAAHRPGPGVVAEDRRHVINAPSCSWAVVVCRGTRRKRMDINEIRGGKSA